MNFKSQYNYPYQNSENWLERAEAVIPLGTQTFSKSRTQFPVGASPLFAKSANGCRVWDIDDNEYIDFISGLASIILGYCDPEIDHAVRNQLEKGVIYSLPHTLEAEVAEIIVEMVPCAERVRFGKNGSDATSGAIRVARAATGRDHVAVCGYHGWQDWYIGSTSRNKGVPDAIQKLTHIFSYNNIESLQEVLQKHPGEFAAVILEPMAIFEPKDNFLQEVSELTHSHGALLIFDEIVSGFRFSNGGAQELFGVIPDLCSLGKGIANGFPLSAVTGKDQYMREMEDVFFSFTMGGETLSLAAAKAVLTKIKQKKVVNSLIEVGANIKKEVIKLINKHELNDWLEIVGHPSWTCLLFKDYDNILGMDIKTLFMQECLARGILTLGSHVLNYAHGKEESEKLYSVYNEVFPIMALAIGKRDIHTYLNCEPLKPLFNVRK